MVRIIHLDKLHNCPDKQWLGSFPTEADFDEVIREDCDIYLPDGTLALVFRKKALKTLCAMTPNTKGFKYWRWASRALLGDQRGLAAGKDIVTNLEIRISEGQKEFFKRAIKGEINTLEEALKICEDTRPSRTTFYVYKVQEDGLYDVQEEEKWETVMRKKNTPPALLKEARNNRNKNRLAWFENWLRTVWAVSTDKVKTAKEGKKRYVTTQPRSNKVYSSVLGMIDRSGRMPYGRLTLPTLQKLEEFKSQTNFFKEVDEKLAETMPKSWKVLSDRFRKVKDETYNLFGTCFTSITVNHNFQVAYHYDGNNAEGAVAVLSVLENGSYDGYEFVLPQLRLAFDIRHGDFLAGDNQGLMHGMMPMKNETSDAECIMFVFYQRDKIIKLDSPECEACRKDFLPYIKENHPQYSNGEKTWLGSFPGMFASPEWEEFKKSRNLVCSNTTYTGSPDVYRGTRADFEN